MSNEVLSFLTERYDSNRVASEDQNAIRSDDHTVEIVARILFAGDEVDAAVKILKESHFLVSG